MPTRATELVMESGNTRLGASNAMALGPWSSPRVRSFVKSEYGGHKRVVPRGDSSPFRMQRSLDVTSSTASGATVSVLGKSSFKLVFPPLGTRIFFFAKLVTCE